MTERERAKRIDDACAVMAVFRGVVDVPLLREYARLQSRFVGACERAVGLTPGDRVAFVGDLKLTPENGWFVYRETFKAGALGTVRDVTFNDHYGVFRVGVVWDTLLWTGHDGVVRTEDAPAEFAMDPKNLERMEEAHAAS